MNLDIGGFSPYRILLAFKRAVNYSQSMKNLTNIALATVFAVITASCSDKSSAPSASSALKQVEAMPKVEMVTTHSVDLNFAVKKIAFAPNSAVPWYGRIILLDDTGKLYSTDIEGRDPKPIKSANGDVRYTDILGFAREKAAGVFLAITNQGTLEAFIESDDYGNFSPLIYGGTPIKAQAFCRPRSPVTEEAVIVDANGKITPLDFTLNTGQIQQSIPVETSTTPPHKSEIIHGQCFYGTASKKSYTYFKPETSPKVLSQSDDDTKTIKNILIENGLSERGLKNVRTVAYTTANYGGGAYADGVIALADADENRIVFISLAYAERQLAKANGSIIPAPPQDK